MTSADQSPVRGADVIIIGGGVAGLSTAWQLKKRGLSVLVIERQQLGNGSSGRAAGLLGQLRGTKAATKMLMDGLQVVYDLEKQTGLEIFVQTGSIRIAETEERSQEIRRLVDMGRSIRFPIVDLEIDKLQERLPYMKVDDIIDACFCPTDGHIQPAELVQAYVKAGRAEGVQYITNCRVEKILVEGGKGVGVQTAQGEFRADFIVNSTGPWSYYLADLSGTSLPTAAIGHYYLTTRPTDKVHVGKRSPAVRNRHHRIYSRPESGGLIVGMYEAEPDEYNIEDLPHDFDMSLMKAARDNYNVALLIHQAQQRFPWINERTPMTITSGIMTFTPDGKPFCGKLPDVEGLYHCAGFSGHGIVQSPAIGTIMSDLITRGETEYNISEIEADRYFELPELRDRVEVKARCADMYGRYYGQIEGQSS